MWPIISPWWALDFSISVSFPQYWLWIVDDQLTVSNDLWAMASLGRRAGQGYRYRLWPWKRMELISPCGNWICNLRLINCTRKQAPLGRRKLKQFSSKCVLCLRIRIKYSYLNTEKFWSFKEKEFEVGIWKKYPVDFLYV